ncbi:MFS transporter [Ureibacillus manganicus]|uniref:Putative proline/betaine transporter n=1 Tax=Ureibacillus manganicus DSM 26584 TaxID=1384049 RepID=A0A0A3I5B2_9BACL|nr:MFS transporter [Ureibacillus manganicus]KGR79986.1 major facilitator transporter [Ureibacillus manganicus DSM 26584]
MSKNQMRRVWIASLVGSSIEWFDYFLYGTVAALVFNQAFFAAEDPTVGLMLAYASFALAFFIRPLGGVIFGYVGDRIGRKKTLVLTLTIMGVATVLMGLLPTYQAIGVAAPIILIALRLVQGLGIGGEWGGSVLLAVEYAPKEKRGFYGAFPQMGVTIGMFLGSGALTFITSVVSPQAFIDWGWRIPFIASAFLVIFGLWIRKGIDETPSFKRVQESGETARLPFVDIFKTQWKEVLIAVGGKVVETAPFYIFATFIVSYGTKNLGFTSTQVLVVVMIATIVTTILMPFMGGLSDKIGRKKVYMFGTVAMLLYAFPYFWLLEQRTFATLLIATVLGLGIIWAPITAVLGTMFSEIFDAKVRYTGVSLGYQIGAAVAGGTAPLIATALLVQFNNSYVPVAIYIMLTSVISLIAVLAVKERSNQELDEFSDVAIENQVEQREKTSVN